MNKIKLYCLPYAGGNSTIFYKELKKKINKKIEIIPIEISGKAIREMGVEHENISEVVENIFINIKNDLNQEYAFFGYSLGSIIFYELAHKLYENKIKNPKHIFFSSIRNPNSSFSNKNITKMKDDELINLIISLDESAKEVFQNKMIREMFLPIIRNDFKIFESFLYKENREKFKFPISILSGSEDDFIEDNIECWKYETDSICNFNYFSGGHFFMKDKNNLNRVIQIIEENLLNKEAIR